MIPAPRDSAARAGIVVAITLATSAAAHVEGGGALPTGHGRAALLAGMALLWLVTAGSGARLVSRWAREANLFGVLALGQLLGHLGYSAGTGSPVVIGAMSGPNTIDEVAGSHAGMAHQGMGHGAMAHTGMAHPGAHAMGATMLACHLVAVLVGQLALRAAEQLVAHARDWLARLTPAAPRPVQPTPTLRARTAPVMRRVRQALPRPPPRRGPPALV